MASNQEDEYADDFDEEDTLSNHGTSEHHQILRRKIPEDLVSVTMIALKSELLLPTYCSRSIKARLLHIIATNGLHCTVEELEFAVQEVILEVFHDELVTFLLAKATS
eukprot:TRINITY_DN464_c0_g1_i9.p4 TRINITY_DN464_c0_g1~~TRINITY_DN464_c0_g1_i9.p4  ORF type:complete len:108 (-),score=10.14 TRINITY_DN464_c0_g1_i9:1418-1741(-)